jgi:hypothetical protein
MKKSSLLVLAALLAVVVNAQAVQPNAEVFARRGGAATPPKAGTSQTPTQQSSGNKVRKPESSSDASKPSGSN